MSVPIYISTINELKSSVALYPLPAFDVVSVVDFSFSSMCIVVSHYKFEVL